MTVDGRAVEVVTQLIDERADAAGVGEVLHQEPPGGHQVDQRRHGRPRAVEVVEGQRDAEPPGQGQQVDTALVDPPRAALALIAL